VAPASPPKLYRLLGANAARHAKGGTPDPARNPYNDEAIEARYHTTVIALMALERGWVRPGAPAEELSREGLQ
jgi:propanediol dehydratase large subunit